MDMEPDMSISNVISLLSGIALFLFGMALMGDGLKKVAGNKLEVILYQLTGKPLKGFLLGTAVTAVIQSSSATSVMVVGFVNSGMMRVRQAISIVMGAILGTSITGWIICLSDLGGGGGWIDLFSTATLTGVISVVGIVLRMFSKNQTKQHVGDILMGFAVLMFGMSTMSAAVSPLRDEPVFLRILTSFSNPLLGILFGTLFTCVLQSASAAVGILQALASTGVIDFSIALPIIMGIAIGAALPVLLSAVGANVDGKRTAMVYLVVEVAGVVFWAAAFYLANAVFRFNFMDMPILESFSEHTDEFSDEQVVNIAGIVQNVKMKTTKNQSMMAYVTLEDDTGSMELLTFSNALGQYGSLLYETSAVVISGRISVRDDKDPQMVVNRVWKLADFDAKGEARAESRQALASKTLYLKIAHTGQKGSEKIVPILNMFPGQVKTVIYYADTGVRMGGRCMPEEIMLEELRGLLGEKNVVLK